ncbi:helix-turn-helix transcriptional regulator [Ramlibacter sp.]|uniref:helix-turn-helix transcriptional regulator n=1 Tax=Ramlibacter sp. TaxID=1917967 RepID=UPI002FCC7526
MDTNKGEALRAESRWISPVLLDLVLDELAYGVAVATGEGEVVHANHAARHELERRRAVGLQNGRLRARLPDDTKVLQEALAKAVDGKRSLISLGAAESGRVSLAVVPVRRNAGPGPAHAALLFSRPSVCGSLMLFFFARSHALTSTEENVLAILCQGYSAPEVAEQLHVAVSTVRSHVRSLCAKTRSSGVRELVNRVAMLPPVAPALLCEAIH